MAVDFKSKLKNPDAKQIASPGEGEAALIPTTVEDPGGVALNDMTAVLGELMADAGKGTEYSSDELPTVYLKILQSTSDETKEESPKYIDGAKPGMLINAMSKELFDVRQMPGKPTPACLTAIFCDKVRSRFVEWVPLSSGGGFVGEHFKDADIVAKKKPNPDPEKKFKFVTADGQHDIVETDYHFPLILDENLTRATIGMKSSELKPSHALNGFIDSYKAPKPDGTKFKPPIYGMVFGLRTKIETKNNNTWWNWDIQYLGLVTDAFKDAVHVSKVFKAAKSFNEEIVSGKYRVQPMIEDDDKKEVPF